MRTIASLLAACLSFLTISALFSAPSCELSCRFRQAHFHCRTVASKPGNDPAMSMHPGMNMGSGNARSEVVWTQVAHAQPDHLMSRDMNMATKSVDETAQPETTTSASRDPFQIDASCAHEACSQTITSDSPPNAGLSRPDFPSLVTINFPALAAIRAGFHSGSCPAIPPDTIPAIEPLAGPLRI